MKRKIIYAFVIVIFAILLIVAIPWMIGKWGCNIIWNKAEILSYYGMILAALGGVFGVFFSVRYSQRQYREDARLRIMPFIATEFILDRECFRSFVERPSENNQIGDINEYDHFVITYSIDKGIKYPLYLSKDKAQLLENKGHYQTKDKDTGMMLRQFKPVLFAPCVLKNIGFGVAQKVTFGLYKLENEKYTQEIDDRRTSIPLLIGKDEKIYVGLFFDLGDDEALGTYRFDLMYSDINQTRYRRSITIRFQQNSETKQLEYQKIDNGEHKIYSMKVLGKIKTFGDDE